MAHDLIYIKRAVSLKCKLDYDVKTIQNCFRAIHLNLTLQWSRYDHVCMGTPLSHWCMNNKLNECVLARMLVRSDRPLTLTTNVGQLMTH